MKSFSSQYYRLCGKSVCVCIYVRERDLLLLLLLFLFLLLHVWYMQVPGPGIESELQLLPIPQLWRCRIPQPTEQGRDPTCTSTVTRVSAVGFWTHCATARTLRENFLKYFGNTVSRAFTFSFSPGASFKFLLYYSQFWVPEWLFITW